MESLTCIMSSGVRMPDVDKNVRHGPACFYVDYTNVEELCEKVISLDLWKLARGAP
jgi:hypothetical protein